MGAKKYVYPQRHLFEERLRSAGYAETSVAGYVTAILTETRDGYETALARWYDLMSPLPPPATFEEVDRRARATRVAPVETQEVPVEPEVEQEDLSLPPPPTPREDMSILEIVSSPEFQKLLQTLKSLEEQGVKGKVLDYIILQFIGVNEV